MAKRYKITLTEEQMRVTQNALEEYFRLRYRQASDFADDLAFSDYKGHENDENHEDFGKRIAIRDAIMAMMKAVFEIAFPWNREKTETEMNCECIWDAIRCARGVSRFPDPFQIGSEPIPEIEVIEYED